MGAGGRGSERSQATGAQRTPMPRRRMHVASGAFFFAGSRLDSSAGARGELLAPMAFGWCDVGDIVARAGREG
eukprot:scaffold13785_cov93-Isochrysis_galbana.AAC.3